MSWRYIGRINQLVILEHGYYFFCLVLPLLAEPLLKSPRITQASAIQNEYPQPGTLGYVFFLFGGSGEQRGFALRSLSTRVGRRGRVAFSLYLRWNSSAARGSIPEYFQFNSIHPILRISNRLCLRLAILRRVDWGLLITIIVVIIIVIITISIY